MAALEHDITKENPVFDSKARESTYISGSDTVSKLIYT